ncbi:hypothetical protein BOTBODRAFT_177313 [Botryobasidium botryosum FD-172 SS1]|uniref:non-specific serine/threonine protein kinase n=1 Tax=Botryobasidium botryosum (strain FD-172 SS1) TaxID=930990 RepID=A0A067M7F2_BOTB1|nr:hypothetical protein BOTBODRAFT_177313 [Botryobasidium botryosum FD-172 SS1]
MNTSASSNVLQNYQLGDSLGKGAFGQVYRALNWTTGETVAVKQIQLSNIPKSELPEIMSEIDLLKNLNHPNIVKYKGFVKTREYLYIILEYCENGSLHNISKRFGKFPENLVAVYISQVLQGLVYLHEQGVIHRDIKGANILTNKDGSVKLADFGVATTPTGALNDAAVVGSPYWMAPEVIEQSGATTASDIWSVGCVVIELLEGKPPYHFLDPMPALFRIVQDDCPPIPEGISPIVKDFLYHCFQKDCNLRVSAKKLLRHPWMASARKQMGSEKASGERPLSTYDVAVQRVQEWNEALKSPSRPNRPAARNGRQGMQDPRSASPIPHPLEASMLGWKTASVAAAPSSGLVQMQAPMPVSAVMPMPMQLLEKNRESLALALQQPEEPTDNWDDDFEEGISLTKLQAVEKTVLDEEKPEADDNALTIKPNRSPPAGPLQLIKSPPVDMVPIVEDYSDLAGEDEENYLQAKVENFKLRNSRRRGLFHPDDIKTIGLNNLSASPSPSPSPSPRTTMGRSSSSPITSVTNLSSHSRSSSVAGSLGRSDARRMLMQSDFERYTEDEDEDYEDVFGKPNGTAAEHVMQTLQLNTRLSNKSWLGDEDSDEEDPFAEIDEGFAENDLETNLYRDKHARLCASVNQFIEELRPGGPDFVLREACDQLWTIMTESPEMQSQLVSAHGMLVILEVLESKPGRDVVLKLLRIVNLLVTADVGALESFCLIGGIPVLMTFTSKKYPSECRLEASTFVELLCHTSVLTLQMFISCRGLKVLVDLLDEDFNEQIELVIRALNGIGSVFELQSPTPKNDFCRMFIREGLLDPLSSALLNVMTTQGPLSSDMKTKIIQILLVFCQVSQSDAHVRGALGVRKVVRRLLRACELLEPVHLVVMLKAVKHLSMNATMLDVLQNANAVEILVKILEEQESGPHSTETSNHIFQTCYNLCRLNKLRQEEAAQAGIIPLLKRVVETNSPLKQFALPILCDLASAGKSCRNALWQQDGLHLYLRLLSDPYFQVSALEAILVWLQDETARVEDFLTQPDSLEYLEKCFVNAKANSFENLLDPFLKICRISSSVTVGVAKGYFFRRLVDRLNHNKAVVRLSLLRILRAICDVHPDRSGLVERYGLYGIVERLSKKDGAVLVRELAREMLPSLATAGSTDGSGGRSNGPDLKKGIEGLGLGAVTPKAGVTPKRRIVRRSVSEAFPSSAANGSFGALHPRPKLKPTRQKLVEIPWQNGVGL